MVAKAMAKKDVSAADKAAIDKLAAEFAEELNNLGVRVANLEKNADNVHWSGSFTQKYMNNNIGRGVGSTGSTAWWEKELWLGLDAKVNDQGWGVHSGIDTKWGTSKGFNEEEPLEGDAGDQYGGNSDNKHDVTFSLYTLNASGPIFKGADLTFGLFQPGLQNGYISNARTKGAKLSYHNGKTQFHVYGGRVYEKYGDLASTWSAFRRGGAELNGGADSATGHGLALDNWGTSIEYRFDGRTSAGIGYYALKHSDAYENGDTLGIVGVNFSRNLLPNLDLSGFYSHGNKHYQNKAYDIRLTYNGSEWGQKPWGAWFGYRYLGSDAQIMSGIDNAAEHPGIKGFDFESYYGDGSLLKGAYSTNCGAGCAAEPLLSERCENGEAGLDFHYTINKGGYAGVIKSLKGVNWSDYNAIQFWITPDGKGQKLIIQTNSNGEDFEVDLTELAKKTEPQLVTLPFSQFKGKNGGAFDKSVVQHFAVYCNAIGDAPVDSHMYFDDIHAVK